MNEAKQAQLIEKWTVGQVADLLGVSVRLLHHWDALGVATASYRANNGYRLYTNADIERIQQALIYRETGMSLTQIRDVLDSDVDVAEHLRRQLQLLTEQSVHLDAKIHAVTRLLEETVNRNKSLSVQEKAEILGSDWKPEWQDEAAARWGETEDHQISQRRQTEMTKADWEDFKAQMDALESELVEAMNAGVEPGSERANELAEQHRAQLSQWYPVTHSKHVLLSRLYQCDERFAAHYERCATGLNDWLCQVIVANARAHGVDPEAARWE